MEPEGSSPCSQQPHTGPYLGPNNSVHALLFRILRSILKLRSIYAQVAQGAFFPSGFPHQNGRIFLVYVRLTAPPPHSAWCHHPNSIWWRTQPHSSTMYNFLLLPSQAQVPPSVAYPSLTLKHQRVRETEAMSVTIRLTSRDYIY